MSRWCQRTGNPAGSLPAPRESSATTVRPSGSVWSCTISSLVVHDQFTAAQHGRAPGTPDGQLLDATRVRGGGGGEAHQRSVRVPQRRAEHILGLDPVRRTETGRGEHHSGRADAPGEQVQEVHGLGDEHAATVVLDAAAAGPVVVVLPAPPRHGDRATGHFPQPAPAHEFPQRHRARLGAVLEARRQADPRRLGHLDQLAGPGQVELQRLLHQHVQLPVRGVGHHLQMGTGRGGHDHEVHVGCVHRDLGRPGDVHAGYHLAGGGHPSGVPCGHTGDLDTRCAQRGKVRQPGDSGTEYDRPAHAALLPVGTNARLMMRRWISLVPS
jgi:hypothetical protein